MYRKVYFTLRLSIRRWSLRLFVRWFVGSFTLQAASVGGPEQARRVRQGAPRALPGVLPDERPRQKRLRQERADRREQRCQEAAA